MAMAKAVNDAELWLPSQILTDADILGDKENDKNGVNADLDASFGFPSEFPYDFYSFGPSGSAMSSPVESVAGSTETDSSGSDVDEDFFAAWSRRLSQSSLYKTPKLTVATCCDRDKTEVQKTRGLARSPQSTLSGIGSWSGSSAVSGDRSPSIGSQVPSPPTTPFPAKNDLAWDVIYAAAGQVARLKMNSEVSKYDFQNGAFLGAPRPAIPKTQAPSIYSNQSFLQAQQASQQQCTSVWGRQAKADWLAQQQQKMQNRAVRNVGYESVKCGRPLSMPHCAWSPLQVQTHNHQQVQLNGSGSRAAANGGSVGRRGCGGTGVFLPRQYGNPPEPRKKTSCAPVLLPSKVVPGRNLKSDDLNAANQTGFSAAFAAEYDALVARRNALLLQQQRISGRPEEVANHDLRLPQDWIY
ncbi:uncharacterized protein LOC114752227 isoform X2 [Neltuma alba]|uniref:uncharacterized protein LOC114736125 isoform X2 n=1 Tax=Neltuma alba TaxID=207710 RepID=UPI0010A4D3C1|nr:uncharacterized protein LOC114736125 isoform X2 [Prosopis alba]XP_028796783.1 uncharacterized protein LOC114752227 isoform X2 [Prosopis alba]